jgi:hypothetical protein
MPLGKLPFRTVIVGSMNDPYMTIERARFLAKAWGAGLVNAGSCGHINVASGFGPWPAGERILNELVSECRLSARLYKEAGASTFFDAGIEALGAVPAPRPARRHGCFAQRKTTKPDAPA